MSLDAMHWVWNHSQSKGNARMAILAIADKAPGSDCVARMGMTEFRQRLNAARSTVINAIDAALKTGELKIVEEARGSRAALYQLPLAVGYIRPTAGSRGPESGPLGDGYRSEIETPSAEQGSGIETPKEMARGPESGPGGSENETPRGPESGPLNQTTSNKQESKPAGASGIPDFARPLVDQLTAAGVVVRWNLSTTEWFELDSLIRKSGISALVDYARKEASRRDIQYARYFLRGGWRELAPLPAPGTERPSHLRAVSGGYEPWRNPTNQDEYDEEL